MAYTESNLAIVCPTCHASIGGKCLRKTLWGSAYIDNPHPNRVQESDKR